MKRTALMGIAVWGLFLAALPMFGHHSMGTYDQSTFVTIQGTVERIEWVNPHSWVTLAVKNANGTTANRRIEIGGPNPLRQAGFDRSFLKIGDSVTFEAWLPKDPRFGDLPAGRFLTLADGRRFDVGDKWGQAMYPAPAPPPAAR